ncbi:MAG TPA: PTS sugar transporter subunit IIC [Candidatus Merdisoma faecalis]|uniref:PTS mannose/fructose/sorbose/N-acetylgalactosamine transporter subunit IIC n=1 Tax=Lachnoclostridium sp. An138 TaxID=1965560 RepID=UPI000B3857BE|nr:PTS sugar transporter subunit IIC [Lachnoclostridium sp. An138]OUQ17962.1 PTS acetylgalactosamine transporter subunit IIC [Lachnoclostridium sp. An138]HIR98567.1 PTS sugar transporter subunit IIC [Candidatus Merdisoma faecalis]
MGDITIIQALLVFVVAFIMGIDQFSFLESLYQPIVTCPIIGAILGNLELGIVVGGAYQLVQIGSMPIGGAQPPNAIMGGIMATVFAVSLNMEASADGVGAALGLAVPFAVFGQYVVTLTFTLFSGMMTKADKYAEEANVKGIRNINLLEMGFLGVLFGVIAVAGLYGGTALGDSLREFSKSFSWVMAGLDAAGGAMKFVGFAILMKVMMSGEMWGFLLAGFAMSLLCSANSTTSGATLILCAFVGAAIAIYDFTTQTKIRQNAGSGFAGGDEDGI